MRRSPPLLPWALLLSLGLFVAGDEAVAALTGWPIDWSYAVAQAAGAGAAWLIAAWLLISLAGEFSGRWITILSHQDRMAVVCCCLGAVESLMRVGCIAWIMENPVEVRHDQSVCDAVTGLNVSGASIAALAIVTAFMAATDVAVKRTDAGASE